MVVEQFDTFFLALSAKKKSDCGFCKPLSGDLEHVALQPLQPPAPAGDDGVK